MRRERERESKYLRVEFVIIVSGFPNGGEVEERLVDKRNGDFFSKCFHNKTKECVIIKETKKK